MGKKKESVDLNKFILKYFFYSHVVPSNAPSRNEILAFVSKFVQE